MNKETVIIDEKRDADTGLKRFGWGCLGYLGATLMGNVITGIGLVILEPMIRSDPAIGYLALPISGLVLWAIWTFAQTREYSSTRTGALVGFYLYIAGFVLGTLGAL